MTKRTGGRRRRGARKSSPTGERGETISGQQLFINTTGGSAVPVPVAPSSFTRALAIADNYQYYRFTRLKIEILPSLEDQASGAQVYASMAAGYNPGSAPDTPPATEAAVLALPYAVFLSQGSTVPRRVTIPRRELVGNGPLKWYKTIASTQDAAFEIQGIVYTFASASGTISNGVNFMIHYTVEFQAWALAGNTPLFVPKDISKLEDHTRMLRAKHEAKVKASSALTSASPCEFLDIAGIRYLRIDN